jgi:hypothetical protein
MKKIWRLTNAQFLYEDSLHYTVSPIAANTGAGELCPKPFKDGILFLSNRKQLRLIEKLNAEQEPFFNLYHSKIFSDSLINGRRVYSKLSKPESRLNAKFNVGPFALYADDSKMVYAKNQNNENKTYGLAFAKFDKNQWFPESEFPFNGKNFSIIDPSISNDGKVLYFSSDMQGGVGGKDIYKSVFENGAWTRPINLGDVINTALDEVSPYYRDNSLYFSSNGHAGLGGLDIFKADVLSDGFDEPKNMGYPINSTHDDFSIVIDSTYRGGYFSSNRIGQGRNDDIFEFEMDLQTYPVAISGHLRYKEHLIDDTSKVATLVNAKMYLVDAVRNVTVFEAVSDSNGQFSLTIPYFSKYKIHVIGPGEHENIVSLEIPKHRQDYSVHDIVVVKDAFKSSSEN